MKEGKLMYYSYAMGMSEEIYKLKEEGFVVENDNKNFRVSFDKTKAEIWEKFIYEHLEVDFWNEYIRDEDVVFIFHLEDGFKKYIVKDFKNQVVLALCEKLCECKFESIKSMLMDNDFYRSKINKFN